MLIVKQGLAPHLLLEAHLCVSWFLVTRCSLRHIVDIPFDWFAPLLSFCEPNLWAIPSPQKTTTTTHFWGASPPPPQRQKAGQPSNTGFFEPCQSDQATRLLLFCTRGGGLYRGLGDEFEPSPRGPHGGERATGTGGRKTQRLPGFGFFFSIGCTDQGGSRTQFFFIGCPTP